MWLSDSYSDSSSESKTPEANKPIVKEEIPPKQSKERDRSRSRENRKHKRSQDGHGHRRSHRSGSRDQKHRRSEHRKHRESDSRKPRHSSKSDHHKRRDSPKSGKHVHRSSSKHRESSRSNNQGHKESTKTETRRESSKHISHRHKDSSSSPDNHKSDRRDHKASRQRSPSPDKRRNYKDDLRDEYCDDAMDPVTRAEKLASNVDCRSGNNRIERARRAQDYQAKELVKKAEKLTGITLPKFYKPSAINPLKFAETEQKRKLLWSKKDEPTEANKSVWNVTSVIASRGDDKGAAKFKKLMGMHDNSAPGDHSLSDLSKKVQEQADLFRRLDADYQSARTHTHTSRGVGLGYNQSAYIDPSLYLAGRREPN